MKKLLIIDDEFIFRQGLRYMMDWEACGYTIAGEASNGREGLALCASLKPDLILCDVVMPVLNGVDFVRELQSPSAPPVIMLSNFDEYDKVRMAFQYGAADYILKSQVTKEMLLACLERISSSQTEASSTRQEKSFGILLRQVLDGYAEKPYPDLAAYLAHRLPASAYVLLFLDHPYPDFKEEHHLEETVRQMVSTELCAAYTTQNHAVCLFGLPNAFSENEIQEMVSGLLLGLKRRIRHTSCAVSRPFTAVSDIRRVAEHLYELTKYSVFYENTLCFYEPEVTPDPAGSEIFPQEEYYSCIRLGRLDAALNILLTYLDSLKNRISMHPYEFKKFVEHTFYTSLRELRQDSSQTQQFSRIELKLFKQLDSAITFIQIRDALAGAFGELASVSASIRPENATVDAMLAYLEEHYSQQVTLYDVAGHLHMNYSYLSAYISQKTGKHFSEHLNDTRIRHAKALLQTTNYSISFISEAIGYTDQSYFGKIFKKYVGQTPLQYRNQFTRK